MLLRKSGHKLRTTFCSYTQVGLSCTKLSYEELHFKFSTYFSFEALIPHLRIGAVVRSVFFFRLDFHSFVRNSFSVGKAILFAKFWWCVGWCDLAMCMALSVGLHSV